MRDDADIALMCRHCTHTIGQSIATDNDTARIRHLETGNQAQQRGLAATGRPDDDSAAAALDGKIDPVESHYRPKILA
ncbi:hypothetical protein D3C73_545890 [compost metagenome]